MGMGLVEGERGREIEGDKQSKLNLPMVIVFFLPINYGFDSQKRPYILLDYKGLSTNKLVHF